MRTDEDFIQKFEMIFGEPLILRVELPQSAAPPSDAADVPPPQGKTVH
jgi:hypothetical protein